METSHLSVELLLQSWIATLIAAPRFGRLGIKSAAKNSRYRFNLCNAGFLANVYRYKCLAIGLLRFLVGISDACLLPAVQALITKYSPQEAAGRIFSYNQSFQAAGNVVGPMIGSSVSSIFGYRGSLSQPQLLCWPTIYWYIAIQKKSAKLHQSHQTH